MVKSWKIDQLKAAFHACDESGTGRLNPEEFITLLKKGDSSFDESQAEQLFCLADTDLSGEVDFDEFLDYICDQADSTACLFRLEKQACEEYAKEALLSKPAGVRSAASKAAKDGDVPWKEMSWMERLMLVHDIERGTKEEAESRKVGAPTKDMTSQYAVEDKSKRISPSTKRKTPESIVERQVAENNDEAHGKAMAISTPSGTGGLFGTSAQVLPTKKFAIAEKSQAELVDYAMRDKDLEEYASGDKAVLEDLRKFKQYLKTARDPFLQVNVIKFIAKGTAGWVFLCEKKETGRNDTGQKVAMKLLRMTSAVSGTKEWYVSKILRAAKISGIVFTEPQVFVVERDKAPEVIKEQLKDAGPVPYYMALFQPLMPWGTLEDLANKGELSPLIMFRALEDVAEALAEMHAKGVQHNDVKPENIMLRMNGNTVISAELCDMGTAEIGDNPQARQNDIRRFGITLFSVATGEGWTKNRLMKEPHDAMLARMADAVQGNSQLERLPDVLKQIWDGHLNMEQIEDLMEELEEAFSP
eukprot:gnl/TRDRNA2_/TRDRNA2_177477_c0_seq2.p1 gnl/TRDRNA2_/TRDRNA2_177477_c0~~gnl/TRDRNA2_/TRDRNA2_177477_c0_seq2.p1  ORF type:complete len:530 (+),score=107.02 gnl/TRDRNA2_/TRDRNA2_177477_c0_seq2:68-1657(+)